MDIVYLRLANGDEIFAHLVTEEGTTVLLDNVMLMETVHVEDDTKYMFLTRYTQYCDKHSLSLDRSQIVFMNEANDAIKNHYQISVEYAIEVADQRFDSGIMKATSFLRKQLKRETIESQSTGSSSSSTKH